MVEIRLRSEGHTALVRRHSQCRTARSETADEPITSKLTSYSSSRKFSMDFCTSLAICGFYQKIVGAFRTLKIMIKFKKPPLGFVDVSSEASTLLTGHR